MILAFAHPCLVVDDVELARSFYEKMFGFRVISNEGWSDNPLVDGAIGSRNSSSRGYMMAGHNCYLELFEFATPSTLLKADNKTSASIVPVPAS